MVKDIVTDNEILGKVCEEASAADTDVAQDLIDTIKANDEAACLHANQIGVTKNLFVYVDEQDEPHVIYNPKLKMGLHASKCTEGCLSHDEEMLVTRYERVKVSYEVMNEGRLVSYISDFNGWMSQVVQHMIDHGKGKLV